MWVRFSPAGRKVSAWSCGLLPELKSGLQLFLWKCSLSLEWYKKLLTLKIRKQAGLAHPSGDWALPSDHYLGLWQQRTGMHSGCHRRLWPGLSRCVLDGHNTSLLSWELWKLRWRAEYHASTPTEAVQIPQPLVEAVVIAVLSLTHRTTSENLYIKTGETKSHWQKETTKAFRRHSLICSLHSNNPKWLLICSNNGVLTDLKVK